MVRLAKKSGLCPSCLTIQGVARLGEHPVDGGGFGDIWKGRLEGVDDQLVCLKVVKVYLMKDIKRLLKVRSTDRNSCRFEALTFAPLPTELPP